MAAPSVTYTFSNGTTASASEVNTNFTDIINGVSDGTKDLSINALTCAGTATLNGAINLGNASSDDLTITASLASSIAIKTNASYGIGSSTLGLTGIYFGNSTYTTRIVPGSLSGSNTLTLPTTTDTLVSTTASQTLTNKTLTAPVISTISNTGTITLPTATDTLVARATTDTLTNKTMVIASNTFTAANANGILFANASSTVTNSSNFFLTTTQLQLADGSVGTPSLSWNGDTNTGIYRVSGDEIGLVAGGTSRLNVNTGGITVNNNTTSDSNLGTISSVTLGHYYEGTISLTFTSGFASNKGVTVAYRRVGKIVTLTFPGTTATSANPGTAFCGSGALPSSLQPTQENYMPATSSNSGTLTWGVCLVRDNANGGTVRIYRNVDQSTVFGTSVTIGWLGFSVTYIV